MARLARIGIDTSKSVFQLHGVDEKEQVVLRKQLRRRQLLMFFAKLEPTLVGLGPVVLPTIGLVNCRSWAIKWC
jgi:transposase